MVNGRPRPSTWAMLGHADNSAALRYAWKAQSKIAHVSVVSAAVSRSGGECGDFSTRLILLSHYPVECGRVGRENAE
jgi:hypothetical protein